jgi:1,4-alpha-glucan branching enzyme
MTVKENPTMSRPFSYSPGSGDRYSAKKMLKPVNFVCVAPQAQEVFLVGDFNDWHPGATPMARQFDGAWTAQVQLNHGHHHYQFLVDGKPMLDPRAQGIARNEKNEKVSLLAVS